MRLFTRHRRRFPAIVLASVLAVTLAGCGDDNKTDNGTNPSSSESLDPAMFPGKAASGAPVLIGLINNENGAHVNQPDNRVAAEATAKYANEHLGGIGGRPIQLVNCATKEEPAGARDCANQMVEKKVAAVVLTSSGFGDLMVPLVTRAGIPWVSISPNGQAELGSPNSFGWSGGFVGVIAAWAKYSQDKGFKKVTVYAVDVPSAVQGVQALGTGLFKKAGATLKLQPIPPGAPDASPQVQAGLKDNPDAVAVVGDEVICTSVLKALGVAAYKGKKLIIQPCVAKSVIEAVGAEAMNGSLVTTPSETHSDDPEAKLYRAVMAKYAAGTDPGGYTVVGYQGVLGLVRATQTLTGAVTSQSIIAAIKSAKDLPLPAGHGIKFTCDGKQLGPLPAPCSGAVVGTPFEDGKLSTDGIELIDGSEMFKP